MRLRHELKSRVTTVERRLEVIAKDPRFAQIAARTRRTPPEVLTVLASHPDVHVRSEVADHPALPLEVRCKLTHDPNGSVVSGAASQPIPVTEYERLSRHADAHVRRVIAKKPDVPAEILARLAYDPDWWVRGAALEHPSLPLEVALDRMQDPDESIQGSVIRDAPLPLHILEQLADDPTELKRMFLAARPRLPDVIAHKLFADPSERVRASLMENVRYGVSTSQLVAWSSTNVEAARLLAARPDAPPDMLVTMCASEDPLLRVRALRNPNLPVSAMLDIIEHPRAPVEPGQCDVSDLTNNPSMPLEVLERLLSHAKLRVRKRAAKVLKRRERDRRGGPS